MSHSSGHGDQSSSSSKNKGSSSQNSMENGTNNNQMKHQEYLPTGGKLMQTFCSYCHIDITQYLRIYCNECFNFILCADCYCTGVELFPHKASHSYRIVDCLHYPIFVKDWTISDELLLLEGIEKHGLGNWKTISDYVGTKSARACSDHYWQDYLGKFGSCLPSHVLNLDDQTEVETCKLGYPNAPSEESLVNIPSKEMIGLPISCYFQSLSEDLPSESSTTQNPSSKIRESLSSSSSSRKEQEIREKLASLPGAEVAGYMPLREDFDTEHNNDAEQLLVDMEFLADDHPSERTMKLKVIEIYNQKLSERDERKKFVIERGIIDVKKQQQIDKKRSKEERDLIARLKVFSRFLSQEEYDALVDGIIDMKKLKRQIECYRSYRSLGIRTVEQARRYETERKRREYQIKAQKSRQSSNYLSSSYSNESGGGGLSYSSSTPTSSGYENQSTTSANVTTRRAQSFSNPSPIPFQLQDMGESSSSQTQGMADHSEGEGGAGTGTGIGTGAGGDRIEVPRSFRSAPGAQLITELELELCYRTQLFPYQYLAILEAVVRECYRNGSLTLEGFHRIIRTDTPPLQSRGIKRSHSSLQMDQQGAGTGAVTGTGTGEGAGDLHSGGAGVTQFGLNPKIVDTLFDFFIEHISKTNFPQYSEFVRKYHGKEEGK